MSGQHIHLMKLGMGRSPQVDVVVKADVLIEALTHYYDKGEAIAYITGSSAKSGDPIDETNAIYIAKLSNEKDHLSLLLVRGDPHRGVPAFVNPKTRTITTVQSNEPGSVRGAAAHIIISKQEIATGKDQGRFRMAMEQTHGISRVLARDLLGTLLNRFAADYPDKFVAEKKRRRRGERAETINYRPTVRFHPHENASLKDDLKQGKIGGFKLKRGRHEFQGEADEPKIQHLDVQLHARIVPTDDFGSVRSLVDHVQQALKDISFEDLKFELVDEDGSPVTLPGRISLEEDAAANADMRYCKKLKITGLEDTPPECHPEFHPVIVRFAKKLIAHDAHWV